MPKTANLAIMFADVSGSTRLFEILGDTAARSKIAACLEILTAVTNLHGGTVIKTIGDEVMCTFPTADAACEAGSQMHEDIKEDLNANSTDGVELSIRVGFHFGPCIMEKGDVFGDAVNVAARMAAQAKSDQIITTQSTVDALDPMLKASSRFVDHAPIKGKKDVIEIYEIIWQEEDVTKMATGMIGGPGPDTGKQAVMQVQYAGKTIAINNDQSSVMMGRSTGCDLPVNEKLASRQHVKIELRRNKFFIIDQSTNGTHVSMDTGESAFLRREEIPITGKGRISLGRSFDENPTEVVVFLEE